MSTHHACMPVDRIRPPVGALHQHLRHNRFLHALRPQLPSAAPQLPTASRLAGAAELVRCGRPARSASKSCHRAARNQVCPSQAGLKAFTPRKLRVSSLMRRTRTTPSLQMMPITVLRGRSTRQSACRRGGRAARAHCAAPRAGGAAGRARCCPPPSAHSQSGRRGRRARRWRWRGHTAQGAHTRLRSRRCAADGTASQRSASAAQRASSAAAHPCAYAGHRAGACRSTAQPGAACTTEDAALYI